MMPPTSAGRKPNSVRQPSNVQAIASPRSAGGCACHHSRPSEERLALESNASFWYNQPFLVGLGACVRGAGLPCAGFKSMAKSPLRAGCHPCSGGGETELTLQGWSDNLKERGMPQRNLGQSAAGASGTPSWLSRRWYAVGIIVAASLLLFAPKSGSRESRVFPVDGSPLFVVADSLSASDA